MKKFPDMDRLDLLIEKSADSDPDIAKAFFAFRLASQKALGKIEGFFTKYNLRHSQVSIMLVLYANENRPETSVNISNKLGLSSATISNVVHTLEKKGFIERKKQESDKRFYSIILSEDGIKFLDDFIPDYQSHYMRLFSNFTEEEIKTMKELSLKLFHNLDTF